jgi:hypothetical protein
MKKRGRGRGSNVNDEGKMTREKKSDEEGKKKQRKGLVGKSHTYSHFSNSAVPRFRPTNEKWLTMKTRFHHWEDPMVGI